MEDNSRGESLCKVCGDKASGKHYGVPSCDGCRGFFKRSIRRYARNLDYVCKENGRCIVDVSRRNQCQACRFTKCLQVNMKRDAVQHERAPRNTSSLVTAARRGPSGLYPGIPHVYHAASNPYHPLLYPALFPFKPTVSAFTPSVAHFLPRSPTESLTVTPAKEDEVTSSEEAGTIDTRIEPKEELTSSRLAPPTINSVSSEYVPNFSILPTENIYEFAAKLLFFAVRWARSIHSFLQLPYRDQTILLEESWSELFVLTAAQWNFPVEETVLVPNDILPERKEVLVDEVRRLRELLAKCTLLRVDHSEYACLKAIVLFKGESRGLCEPGRVTALQEQTVAVFCERDARRVGRLLLLLPPARALCRSTLQELLFKPTVGDVSVERLLGDMVSALRPT
ncbi:nuclear receptor subfamily 2 group E member 1 [Osmia lignaria lignaria]|uniref:nuclear receptor subfamily 2 group E member 1 n=1 Tax=Osmia lignaria lignaria TaxID=1437193 RepID=UPI0014796553|nr:COUP transcription factor 2-like [Osmia lignaria]XP_034183314.1 COUP transcription factor 2-like [Osmia lignaria]